MSKRSRTEISSCWVFTTARILLCLVVMPTVCVKGLLPCSLELVDLVEDMLKDTDGMSLIEERLYTPNEADYEKCPKSTLTCFAEEVKVLVYHNPVFRDMRLTRRLMSINTRATTPEDIPALNHCLHLKSHPDQKAEDSGRCVQCEVNNLEPAEKFLSTMKYILQQMNAHGCGRLS